MTEWPHGSQLPSSCLPQQLAWSKRYSWEGMPLKRPYAAVAVLFCPGPKTDDPAHLVLTRRSLNVGTHKGQMSLAGGFYEIEDGTIGRTASRELWEEIGISSQEIILHGSLNPLQSIRGTVIYPIVMTTSLSSDFFQPDGVEVAQIVTIPWTQLKRSRSQPFTTTAYRIKRNSQRFALPTANIWGLTAQIIYDADFT